jgi:hypothetical protein
LGRHYHQEGSTELAAWVEELKELVYGGNTKTLLKHLRRLRSEVPTRGPGTKGRRRALTKLMGLPVLCANPGVFGDFPAVVPWLVFL